MRLYQTLESVSVKFLFLPPTGNPESPLAGSENERRLAFRRLCDVGVRVPPRFAHIWLSLSLFEGKFMHQLLLFYLTLCSTLSVGQVVSRDWANRDGVERALLSLNALSAFVDRFGMFTFLFPL